MPGQSIVEPEWRLNGHVFTNDEFLAPHGCLVRRVGREVAEGELCWCSLLQTAASDLEVSGSAFNVCPSTVLS